jgi:hypothetical protein
MEENKISKATRAERDGFTRMVNSKRRKKMPEMGIGVAIASMREGKRVARSGWNGKGMYLELQVPDTNSKMTLPYVYMKTAQGDLVPWLCSQTDLLATDWSVV